MLQHEFSVSHYALSLLLLITLEVKTYLLLCLPKILRWKYAECIESAGEVDAVASPADGLYYPAWDLEEDICANDGKQPVYMTNNPTIWMHSSFFAPSFEGKTSRSKL